MKKLLGAIFIILIGLMGCNLANDPYQEIPQNTNTGGDDDDDNPIDDTELNYVFDLSALSTITITISSNEWNKILTNYDVNDGNETSVIAQIFSFNKNGTEDIETNIGFRIRGNTSRERPEGSTGLLHSASSPDWHHAHFRIDFTETTNVNRFHGLRAINLKWFKEDLDYCREVYNYDLFRRFGVWTAPRSSYAKLYIKIAEDPSTAYFGIYEMVESIDRSFLRIRFGNADQKDGNLWKCLWGANMDTPINNSDIGIENIPLFGSAFRPCYDFKAYNENFYSNKYEAFTNEAAPQMRDFVSKLNTLTGTAFVAWITNAMDVDLFLKTYAVSVAVGMWDDYWASYGNNYYFYFANNGKAYFIPYDYDNSLGVSYSYGSYVGTLGVDNTGTRSFLDWNGSEDNPPLIAKILGQTIFMNKYKTYIEQLINPTNHYFTFIDSTNRITSWQTMVNSYVANDTGEDMSIVDSSYTGWAYLDYYMLLTGDDSGAASSAPGANYFRTRIKTACTDLGLNYSLYRDAGLGGGGSTNTNSSDPLASDTTAYSTMYIAGDFNSWGTGSNPMTLLSNSLWSVTVSGVSSGDEYKFMNTTSWSDADWGDGDYPNDGVAVLEAPNNMTCDKSGTVKFYFDDSTYEYWTSY